MATSVATRLFEHVAHVRPKWRIQDVQFSQITCALSNTVYRVQAGQEKLLLRIYGSSDHGLFTRPDEVRQTLYLGSFGFGPKVIHTWEEGRIESWLEGFTPSNEYFRSPEAIRAVALKLRALHEKTGMNHNDLHRNNMLFAQDGSVEFLDFEYSGPADPTYDLANHFNEWMYPYEGPDTHLFQESLYPSLCQRREFASAYLGNTAGKGAFVEDFLAQVERRREDSHLFWIEWADRTGPSEFNDLYARARRTLLQRQELPKMQQQDVPAQAHSESSESVALSVVRTLGFLGTLRPLSTLVGGNLTRDLCSSS